MQWWHWRRSQRDLESWIRPLIGTRPYTVRWGPGEGSWCDFANRELVIDPIAVDTWGGISLVPRRWIGTLLRTLKVLQWRCSRAISRHEAAHVLFTDYIHGDSEAHQDLINILEDGRIERLLAALYPWVWRDFVELGLILWQQFTLSPQPALRLYGACLLHRWDVLRPRRTPSRITFDDPEVYDLWLDTIRPLVEEAWIAPSTQRVAEIAREILRIIRDYAAAHDDATGNVIAAGRGLALPRAINCDKHPTGERALDDPAIPGDAVFSPPDRDMAVDESSVEDAGEPPDADLDPSAGQLWMLPYQALEQSVMPDVRRQVAVFAPPTPDVEGRPSDTSGEFDIDHFIRSRGDTPFLHRVDEDESPEGLALVALIDRTGSMGNTVRCIDAHGMPDASFFDPTDRMVHARKAAMLLDRACAAADIPLCIGFAGNLFLPYHLYTGRLSRDERRRVLLPHPVVWLREWHTPRDAEGPRALIAGLYGEGECEAVSDSLLLAEAKLQQRTEATKLILYIHDGCPTDEDPNAVRATVQRVRQRGIIVIGIYVGPQDDVALLQAIFGPDHTIGVQDITKLPDRLWPILKRYYRR